MTELFPQIANSSIICHVCRNTITMLKNAQFISDKNAKYSFGSKTFSDNDPDFTTNSMVVHTSPQGLGESPIDKRKIKSKH